LGSLGIRLAVIDRWPLFRGGRKHRFDCNIKKSELQNVKMSKSQNVETTKRQNVKTAMLQNILIKKRQLLKRQNIQTSKHQTLQGQTVKLQNVKTSNTVSNPATANVVQNLSQVALPLNPITKEIRKKYFLPFRVKPVLMIKIERLSNDHLLTMTRLNLTHHLCFSDNPRPLFQVQG
jgi:hypothetical protein